MTKQKGDGNLSSRQLYRMGQKKKMESRRSLRSTSQEPPSSCDDDRKSMRKIFSSTKRLSKGSSKLLRRISKSFRKSSKTNRTTSSSISASSPTTIDSRSVSSTNSVDGSAIDKKKRKGLLKKVWKKRLSSFFQKHKNRKATGSVESSEDASSTSPEDYSSSSTNEGVEGAASTKVKPIKFKEDDFFIWENVPDRLNVVKERVPKSNIIIENSEETAVLTNKAGRPSASSPSSQSLFVRRFYSLMLFFGAFSVYMEQQGTSNNHTPNFDDLAKLGASSVTTFVSEFPSVKELQHMFFLKESSDVLSLSSVQQMVEKDDLSELMWSFGG